MSTKLKFGKEAREALRAGAEQVYRAVGSTLGARGRNVVRQTFGRPKITNDGVSIARAIDLEDPFEKQGADLIKESAEQTVRETGDGTSTSVVFDYNFFEKGLALVDKGLNPVLLKKKIKAMSEIVLEKLKANSIAIKDDSDLVNIATISVESPEYGAIIADAVKIADKDGMVFVEEDSKIGIKKEVVHGYRFDRGWESPYLVTNSERMEAVLEEKDGKGIYILVADKSWNLVDDLMPLFDELRQAGHDKLLIIAEEISGELMSFLVLNRMKLRFHAVVVKVPFNKDMLEDIADLTGAQAVTSAKGIVDVRMTHLGKAKKIIVTQRETTIVEGAGKVEDKVQALRAQIAEADEGYEKDKLQDRLAKLTGKTVILKIGASTEAEAKYLKDKFDDAVAATRAAVEEGVVAGGGIAFKDIADELYGGTGLTDEEELMRAVLHSPLDKILENAGEAFPEEVREKIRGKKNAGYDALKGEITDDIVKAGILDPLKVARCAFKNAVSLACELLVTNTIIAEIKDEPANR